MSKDKTIKAWAIIDKKGEIGDDGKRHDIYRLKEKAEDGKIWWGKKEDKIVRVEIKILKSSNI